MRDMARGRLWGWVLDALERGDVAGARQTREDRASLRDFGFDLVIQALGREPQALMLRNLPRRLSASTHRVSHGRSGKRGAGQAD